MAPPSLTTGEAVTGPWILTPDFLKNRAREVHDGLLNLNDAIDKEVKASRIATTSGRYKAWKRALARWDAWYGGTDGSTWLWSGTEATLESWENTLRDWQRWFRMTFPSGAAELQAPPPSYEPPIGGRTGGLPWWAWALLGGAGAYGAYKVLK